MMESSRLTTLIKFQKLNKKIASRILVIKDEDEIVSVIIQELNNSKNSNFPLNAIRFVERLEENDEFNFANELKHFKTAVPVRLKFLQKYKNVNFLYCL